MSCKAEKHNSHKNGDLFAQTIRYRAMLNIHLFINQKSCLNTTRNIFTTNADTNLNLPLLFRINYLTANGQIWCFYRHIFPLKNLVTNMFSTFTLKQGDVVPPDPNIILLGLLSNYQITHRV